MPHRCPYENGYVDRTIEDSIKCFRCNWFVKEGIRATSSRFLFEFTVTISSNHDDGRCGLNPSALCQQLQTVHAWEPNISYNDIVMTPVDCRKSGLGILCRIDYKPAPVSEHKLTCGIQKRAVVVDDE
jgi:hypothetical protein